MRADLLGIFCGQTFATAGGDEFTVVDLDPKHGYAVIETLKEERGVLELGAMLQAIHDGVLVNVSEKGDDAEGSDL